MITFHRHVWKPPLVPPKRKSDRIEYLCGHPRYHTMNSWNRSTAPSRTIKLSYIDFPNRDAEETAYEVIQLENFMRETGFSQPLDDWQAWWRHEYQWATNGRSGGYIVMYRGGIKDPKDCYKRYCTRCGQGNYKAESTKCGRCGAEGLIDYPFVTTECFPGQSLWEEEVESRFADYDAGDVGSVFDVVYSFDIAVNQAIDNFIYFCEQHKVEEEEVMVARKVKVAVERDDA